MKNLMLLGLLLIMISSCCKEKEEPFFHEKISSFPWALNAVKDADDNVIIEKPKDLPQDIYFFFTNDFRIIGHISSFIIYSSEYLITEDSIFSIPQLSYGKLPIKNEWDQFFIDNYQSINKYEYSPDNTLKLFFGDDNSKFIFISN